MPFINVKTNAALTKAQAEQIKADLGNAITAVPGKSEQWLMVSLAGEQTLYFQGSDTPAAIAEVSLYGNASGSALDKLTGLITESLTKQLGVSASRVYVSYHPTQYWGWNGNNL